MTRALWHIGDTLTVLQTLPTASVDLVLTSPPFLALRSYLPADDPAKAHEMGSEATPGAFLAPHGSLAVELAETPGRWPAQVIDTGGLL